MKQFNKAQVIILPNINGILYKSPNGNPNFNGGLKLVSDFDKDHYKRIEGFNKAQHLYIVSDDKIKKGDWFINELNELWQHNGKIQPYKRSKKIIATTDTSLKLHDNSGNNHCFGTQLSGNCKHSLPQPSQQFITKYIEEYNKNNIITNVLVEYKSRIFIPDGTLYDLVINQDNTINIQLPKDSWNKEEIKEKLLEALQADGPGSYNMGWEYKDAKKWIEENL